MKRVLFLTPVHTDADVGRHANAIASGESVNFTHRNVAAGATLVETLRTGANLFRGRRHFDTVVTVGPSALAAANVGWRGPLVHIPVGELSTSEVHIARRMAARDTIQFVTTSHAIADAASELVDDARRIHVLRPASALSTFTRAEARARLGVPADAPLFHLIGLNRRGSGHRLGLWVTSILAFRDPTARATVTLGGERDGFLTRFAESTNQTHALIAEGRLRAADFAIAADVAICPADGAPDYAALAACGVAGTPVVGLRKTWDRERLGDIQATFPLEPRARLFAQAALQAFERGRDVPHALSLTPDAIKSKWSEILASRSLVGA